LACRAVDSDEARALANADPAVQAGWFDVVVDPWWIRMRSRSAIGST
jgi:uncharacterized protein YciI